MRQRDHRRTGWNACICASHIGPAFAQIAQATLVPLDLTDARSVRELAGEIGGRVDIVINNAEVHRAFGISSRPGTDAARLEMDVNYFGLLRLAQTVLPA